MALAFTANPPPWQPQFTQPSCPRHGRRSMRHGLVLRAARATPETWQEKAQACFANDSRPVILFDGVCNLCNGAVNFVLNNEANESLRFAALQSGIGKALLQRSGRSPHDISSVVLVEKQGSYIKSEAVLRTARHLSEPYPSLASLAVLFPLFMRDAIYDLVADNRYTIFGQSNYCRTSDAQFKERFLE